MGESETKSSRKEKGYSLQKKLLNDKGYSYSSIQSYINFSQACENYPMILVSTDYYSEWQKFHTIFLAEVQKDSQLQSRCMTELQFS